MYLLCYLQDTVGIWGTFYLYQLPVTDSTPPETETTAHSLAATLGFIGLHDDIQNEVLEQIVSVVGYDRDPVCFGYPMSCARIPTPPCYSLAVIFRSLKTMPSWTKYSPCSTRRYACSVRITPLRDDE
jgi:hypothetical protein